MSAQKHQHKRSWKNLLINKRYQLRFTLFMVGLSTVLMGGLGLWVMKVANETTAVSMASVRGTPCPKIPDLAELAEDQPVVEPVPMKLPDPNEEPAEPPPPPPEPVPEPAKPEAGSAAGSGEGSAVDGDDEPPRRAVVQMDESSMTMTVAEPVVPADFGAKVVGHWTCDLRLAGQLDKLEDGRRLILLVLIATGLMLVIGLAIYGIKMTHKVAGPLFKVTLYLSKMREGRYDKVWNLRKGDQLVDFYEHFKTAHAGVVTMEKDDIAKIKDVIAAAEAAGAGDHPSVAELRTLLARKEKSVE